VTVLLGEPPPHREQPRVIVPESERPEPTEEIQQPTSGAVHVVHALRAVDQHPISSEQLHHPQLPRADMPPEQLGHRRRIHRRRIIDAQQRRPDKVAARSGVHRPP
jgi:hypothetical protein